MMSANRSRIGPAMALLACWGCGGSVAPPVSSSSEEATVRGTVSVRGKAPTNAEIVFDPSNINRKDATPRSFKIGPDGQYTIKTLVGENSVTVHGDEIDKDPVLSSNSRMLDVKTGENTFPIELP